MIKIQNLTKVFKIEHEKKRTIFELLIYLFKKKSKIEKLYALKNINFEINDGDFIGIIGRNGSGKTTLLKIISRILVPTKGGVIVRGKVISFLELGVGFHDDLTAKENVYLYGALIGMTKKEIDKKFNKIIQFSNLEKFVDTRLRSFSSGMKVRLAFSTAIQTNFDILILDEILAVGDKDFQKKCYDIFNKFSKQGKTIILTSHDLDVVNKFCNKVLLLDRGRRILFDKTDKVLKKYSKI